MSLLRSHRLTHTYLRPAGMARRNLSLSRPLGAAHDPHKEPFGSYRRQPYIVPDFTAEQLTNRVTNAPLLRLVESYRLHGHRAALLDPLDLSSRPTVPALDPRRYGFELESPDDLRDDFRSDVLPVLSGERKVDTDGILEFPEGGGRRTLEEVRERLESVYCHGVGYEFMHLPSKHERRFLTSLLERSHLSPISPDQQLAQFHLLSRSEWFDSWAAKRMPNVKRYGLEGGESMMVALGTVLERAQKRGIRDTVLAMPHRGRLNVLTEFLGLDLRLLVRKMRGLPTLPPSLPPSQFTDDVLSHLFLSSPFTSSSSSSSDPMTIHLLPNPSHLETVTPIGQGFARGLQIPFSTSGSPPSDLGEKVLNVAIHGDGAFIGQGIVGETLNLSGLPHFNIGGTIRIVVNNQLGYTTSSLDARTSFYATDLAKSISAPIVHVNGDRIDDVARAVELAMAYQEQFKKDVVIDLVVYRRRGHNELDEPSFTSPVMYRTIASLPSVPSLYTFSLIASEVLSPSIVAASKAAYTAKLDASLEAALPQNFIVPELERPRGWGEIQWAGVGEWEERVETGVEESVLKEVGRTSVAVEDGFKLHPRLVKMHIAKRLAAIKEGKNIDFATAEALAFGSLVLEGFHVRLCGQDSGRGTFSQRHAVMSDQESVATTVPLEALTKNEGAGTIEIVNSPLSEYAVIGFEQGLAWVSPKMLPIWEAQFGDFINTAQVAVDTLLGSAESKWGLPSALTLLLPHGYDSAGPEHSSARIERFLQLTNEPLHRTPFVPNIHLVNVTTPAQYFHLLRRQMVREYRKPLVVFSPKGILRLPAASSTLEEMTPGTSFLPVLDDPSMTSTSDVQKIILLSGKMYYDLIKSRSDLSLHSKIAFIRIEEISPFPYAALSSILARYPSSATLTYAQEEPENAGSYLFFLPRLAQIDERKVAYVGRESMSVPAPGVGSYFAEGKERILREVFEGIQ